MKFQRENLIFDETRKKSNDIIEMLNKVYRDNALEKKIIFKSIKRFNESC